jgi:hypothetical protein
MVASQTTPTGDRVRSDWPRWLASSARYHPVRRQAQLLYSGRLALGLDVNG